MAIDFTQQKSSGIDFTKYGDPLPPPKTIGGVANKGLLDGVYPYAAFNTDHPTPHIPVLISSETKTSTPSVGADDPFRILNSVQDAFSGGYEQSKEGFDQAKNATNVIDLLVGSGRMLAGAAGATGAPFALPFSLISPFLNAAAEGVSNIPAVQKFSDTTGGKVAGGIAEATLDTATIFGLLAGFARPGIPTPVKLPVRSESVESNIQLTRGRKLNVKSAGKETPINIFTPYTPFDELPVIPFGKKGVPKESVYNNLPAIETQDPMSLSRPIETYPGTGPAFIPTRPIAKTPTPATPVQVSGSPVRAEPTATPVQVSGSPVRAEPTATPVQVSGSPVRAEPTAIPGETKPTKSALDINKQFAQQGVDELPEKDLAQYTATTKAEQEQKISEFMDNEQKSNDAALGKGPTPEGILSQALFNAVKRRASAQGNGQLLLDLAKSPLNTERSQLAQSLGAAGYNNSFADPVKAITELLTARYDAAVRQGLVPEKQITQEVSGAKQVIKETAPTKNEWKTFIDSIEC